MKTRLLAAITAFFAWGNMAHAFDYSQFEYTWTDKDGATHTSKITEKATDARQMVALRDYVMKNPDIPGNLNVDGIEGDDITKYPSGQKPVKDGFTCFLIELKDGATTVPSDAAEFEKNVNSVQLLSNVAESDNAYIVSFSGSFDKFYFVAKGKARVGVGAENWERLSATGNNGVVTDGTPDFYQKLMAGETYKVAHDCGNLPSLRHYYKINPGTGNEPYMQNVTMMVPKNRMTQWSSSDFNPPFIWPNSSGTARDDSGPFTWYHPEKCPRIALYQASLLGDIAPASDYSEESEETRLFTVKLDWKSNLKDPQSLNWPGGETYDIYIVGDDGEETLLSTVNDVTTYLYNVQQHKQGYQLHYKVVCRPTESEPSNPVGPAITNTVTLSVPGYNDEFIWVYGYRSRFDVGTHQNSYKNTIRLSPYKYDLSATPERVVYRKKADGTGITKIATLAVDADGRYTVQYENAMPTSAALRFDAEPLTTEGNVADMILINDYFLASTADGGDLAGSYIYYITEPNSLGQLTTEQVEIPVYWSTITSEYVNEYNNFDVLKDEERSLNVNDKAVVKMESHEGEQKYHAVVSWDIYNGRSIGYSGTKTANIDIKGNQLNKYTGQMTVNSFYGPNTYGTNEALVQGANIAISADGGWTEYKNAVLYPQGGMYAYQGNVRITPTTANVVAPYVYYYRLWRVEDGVETLINSQPENKGNGWGTNYETIKTNYPAGNATSSTELQKDVFDIYVEEAFAQGGEKEVTYIVRMYTTPTPLEEEDPVDSKKKVGPVIATQKIYISENNVVITYNTDKHIVTGVNDLNADKSIVSVKYYNMLGIEADTPFDGVNIKVVKHADGSISQTKIIK